MVWPFPKKCHRQACSDSELFKNGVSFFKFQCKFGDIDIVSMQDIVALNLDSSKEFGTEHTVKLGPDGRHIATLKLASSDRGFLVMAQTNSGKGDRLKPDEIVIWLPVSHIKEIVRNRVDDRSGSTSLIVGKVTPEFSLVHPNFEFTGKY